MRIRQMGFSSRLKAHKHILTLETLKFICAFISEPNAKMAALNSGIPETYATRQGHWLKKHTLVKKALEQEYDSSDIKKLQRAISVIEAQMQDCKIILGLEDID